LLTRHRNEQLKREHKGTKKIKIKITARTKKIQSVKNLLRADDDYDDGDDDDNDDNNNNNKSHVVRKFFCRITNKKLSVSETTL
jgi:hypothetical protein